jgi:glycosyltransferase involved in cell wall biosynthesis
MRVAVTVEQSWHVVPGGIATATVELVRALVARTDVEVIGVAARHVEPPPPDLTPPVEVGQFALTRRALYASWQWLRRPVVERAAGPVDVVHDAGYVVPPSRAPLVATVHDLAFLEYPRHYGWRTLAVLRRGMALARREARLVMCPSRTTIEACRAAGFDPARLRLVPWGVAAAPVDGAAVDALRARYGLDRPYVLFVGTVEPRKNLPRVLEAFRGLGRDDVLLVLAGPRGWKEDVADAAVDGGVRWLGAVARGDLGGLYTGAAAFVYPSLLEGFGLPVLEAMAHGTPVVTSAGTATAEVAGDAALLVDPLDTDAIAEGVDRVLRDPELSERLRSRGRIRAGGFTWERSAELAVEVYAEAAAGSSG